jgi:hypothetical protein
MNGLVAIGVLRHLVGYVCQSVAAGSATTACLELWSLRDAVITAWWKSSTGTFGTPFAW